MLDKTYSPADIEAKWYEHWETSGAFKCGQRKDAEPYVIVMPPPNVTGSLHMGHALDNRAKMCCGNQVRTTPASQPKWLLSVNWMLKTVL